MQNVLVYAPSAATRKVYHQNLTKRECDVYRAQDIAEFLLLLVTFEVDTLILVDEGTRQHELETILDIVKKKYDTKKIIIVSASIMYPGGSIERFATSGEFFDSLV